MAAEVAPNVPNQDADKAVACNDEVLRSVFKFNASLPHFLAEVWHKHVRGRLAKGKLEKFYRLRF